MAVTDTMARQAAADAGHACATRVVDQGRVQAVRTALPTEGRIAELARVFLLLGEPGRLRLLTSLLEAGELCVCELAAAAGMSESSASHALRLLRAARIVSVQRRGRMAYYRLDDGHVRMVLELALTHASHTGPMSAVAGRTGAS